MRFGRVATDATMQRFIGWLIAGEEKREWLGVDTETTGLAWDDQLRSVQFGDKDEGWFIPYEEHTRGLIHDVLADYRGKMVLHHAKFDARFLARAGLPVDKLHHDTKVMAHLLDSSASTSLKELGVRYLSLDSDKFQKELRVVMRKNKWTWATIPLDCPEYWQYAAFDAVLTARLAERLHPNVIGAFAELYEMECHLAQVMREAEFRGFRLDRAYAKEKSDELDQQIKEIDERWPTINLGSTKQIAQRLMEDGVTVPRTPKGNPSVPAGVLERIDHTLAQDVLAIRGLSKTKSTYFDSFLELADGNDRLHPLVNTLGARTGRMSCEQPNLQNVPRGSFVRPALISSEARILVMADYSQIEYRLLACLAQEQRMIQSFLEGKDFHSETARIILGREPTPEDRAKFKNVNFAQIYEAGVGKLMVMTGASEQEIRTFVKEYDEQFPNVKKFKQSVQRWARDNGMAIYTMDGRRCPVDSDRVYSAVNYLIQGTAADVLKRAIIRIAGTKWIQYFILPVHDELIFDVPVEEADELVAALPDLMEVRDRFAVPLTVEVKRQSRWGVAEEVEA